MAEPQERDVPRERDLPTVEDLPRIEDLPQIVLPRAEMSQGDMPVVQDPPGDRVGR